jgi:2-polyprenyl-3-methyl-5-hydroxy-6-metoxy-1,4-benzoquinol methylase
VTTYPDYAYLEAEYEPESTRHKLWQKFNDHGTIRRLNSIGVKPGWRVLEIGAGGGSIARHMAGMVGPSGYVLAGDLSTRFLADMPPQVEVRQMDIRSAELEAGAFDFVHCRGLLVHMPDPSAVLRKMAAALRMEGILLVEEPDYGLLNFGGHEDGVVCTQLFHRVISSLVTAKIMDPYWPRNLPAKLLEIGFESVASEFEADAAVGVGHPNYDFHCFTFIKNAVDGGVDRGLLTAQEYERICAVMEHPSTRALFSVMIACWARRTA